MACCKDCKFYKSDDDCREFAPKKEPPPLIFALGLSVSASGACRRLGIFTVKYLQQHTVDELLSAGKIFSLSDIVEIQEKLKSHGLKLRGDS